MKNFLLALDPNDPTKWTTDGLPRIDVLQKQFGPTVTREAVNIAVPGLTRSTATQVVPVSTVYVTLNEVDVALEKVDEQLSHLQKERKKLLDSRDRILLAQPLAKWDDPILASSRHALAERLARTPEQRLFANARRSRRNGV